MPPRLSLRRLFLYVVACGGAALLLSNVRTSWSRWRDASAPASSSAGAQPAADGGVVVASGQGSHRPHRQEEEKTTIKEVVDDRPREKPWFMHGGTLRPTPLLTSQAPPLFPSEAPSADRVAQQLMYVPPGYSDDTPPKKILVYNGLATWAPAAAGMHTFKHNKCPVDRCMLTANRDEAQDADAILYKDQFLLPPISRPSTQLWILYFLECPYHTGHMKYSDVFNWTATYRHDSDIVAPYERWTYYDDRVRQRVQERNYAANKTRKVAWFVSNCGARNERLAYARELQKHIQVDIYGEENEIIYEPRVL